MRIFLTGATGFIGSHVIPELQAAGHEVVGTSRTEKGAATLALAGVEPHRATLEDPEGLARGAATADAVIHTAFDHDDFTRFAENCAKDRAVIAALGAVLRGTDKPLLITSGVGMGSTKPGDVAQEDVFDRDSHVPRVATELAGEAVADTGVNVSVMRLPQVHDTRKQGLVTPYVALSRAKGLVAYTGDGQNCWSAAHVSDVARLYRLAIERGERGARYNAVAEEGVPMRAIAEAVGRGLGVPVRALEGDAVAAHFGWMAMFAGWDMRASSARTRATLDWHPAGPGLIADLEAMDYSEAAA